MFPPNVCRHCQSRLNIPRNWTDCWSRIRFCSPNL
ncbi:DUF2256 domain-containing protein [uncultured Duncaniella sp.]